MKKLERQQKLKTKKAEYSELEKGYIKKYGERISGPIEELNRALMDMFRMIEGNEKTEENTQDR